LLSFTVGVNDDLIMQHNQGSDREPLQIVTAVLQVLY